MTYISIISVVYNHANALERTLTSVIKLNSDAIEYCVVDGDSSDGTKEVIQNNSKYIDAFISEPDQGIFDAMNKGIKMSKGRWLIFINAGDEVRFDNSILAELKEYENNAIVYGNTERSGGLITKPLDLDLIKSGGLPMCHQSTFYNRELLGDDMVYDTKYRLFGENELLMRIIHKDYPVHYMDTLCSYFEGGGISSQISWETRKARYYYLYKYFGLKGLWNGIRYKLKSRLN